MFIEWKQIFATIGSKAATYSACGPLTKHRERIRKFRERGNLKHLYRNKLENARLAHDATYSRSKRLVKRATVFQIRF